MDSQLQRDFGRVEATVEIVKNDVKELKHDFSTFKTDLEEIKRKLSNSQAVKDSDWKRLSVVAVLASLATHIFNWLRPLFV